MLAFHLYLCTFFQNLLVCQKIPSGASTHNDMLCTQHMGLSCATFSLSKIPSVKLNVHKHQKRLQKVLRLT